MPRTLNGGVGKSRGLRFFQGLCLRPKPGGSKGRIGAIGGLKQGVKMKNRLNARSVWLLSEGRMETEKECAENGGRDRKGPQESNRHTGCWLERG